MRISRVNPPTLSWDKGFTLYGDFKKSSYKNNGRYVVLGGGSLYRCLKIREWNEDRIVVESPKSGRSNNHCVQIDPQVPYFLSVVSVEDHSNLFLIKINPEGLPDWY